MTVYPEANLRECILMSMKPDMDAKRVAEKQLEEISRNPSFLTALLHLSAKDQEPAVRMFAASYFRRYLEKFWSLEGFDKHSIIKELPGILLSSSKDGEKHLLAALQFILKEEQADQWAPIMEKVSAFIASSEKRAVEVGLKILNRVIIAFVEEYKAEKEFEMIFDTLGVPILSILANAAKEGDAETAGLAMKVFGHSCESYMIPNAFKTPQFVQNLISVIEMTINTLYKFVAPVKWSLVVLNGLLKKTRKKKDLPAFAIFERKEVLEVLYGNAVRILDMYTQTKASERVEAQAFDLIRNVVGKPAGWEIVKRDALSIVTRFILPAVSLTETMESSWEACQIDFMREIEAQYTKNADTIASELFLDIVKKAGGTGESSALIVSTLLREVAGYPAQEAVRLRFGGLVLLKVAGKYFSKNQDAMNMVISDISAPHAIIQYAAFSTLQHFSYYVDMPAAALRPFLAGVESPEIGVSVESILCLPNILANEEMRQCLRASIPNFVKLLLDLANKVQIEALATALEDVIVLCTEETLQFAPGIVQAICASVIQLLGDAEDDSGEGEPEEKYEVLDGYVRTITTLIEALEKNPEGIRALIEPVIKMTVQVGSTHPDFFPDLFSLLVVASYTMKSVDGMFEALDVMLKLPGDTLAIYISEVSAVLDNFITYGCEKMCAYVEPIFAILRDMMQGVILEYDFPYLCRILESILLNMGHLLGNGFGTVIEASIQLVLSDKEMLETPVSLISAVEVLLCSVIVMPGFSVNVLQKGGHVAFLMDTIKAEHKKFERVHDLKLLLLFSGMMLSQGEGTLPAQMQGDLLVSVFAFAIKGMPAALARREALKREDEYNEDEESYGGMECFDEDPSFETPLDRIDPFNYAKGVCNSAPGTVMHAAWMGLPEKERMEIFNVIQKK
ncbi:importin-7 [Nematocida major]|uniref:importin-7 n=1 Tax=Nematocida major TaxID=1912982 RepID=UPI002007C99C|nr:importin-7 [Nematocida major]KAH9386588.1 importin-7 [Nematocida major]